MPFNYEEGLELINLDSMTEEEVHKEIHDVRQARHASKSYLIISSKGQLPRLLREIADFQACIVMGTYGSKAKSTKSIKSHTVKLIVEDNV